MALYLSLGSSSLSGAAESKQNPAESRSTAVIHSTPDLWHKNISKFVSEPVIWFDRYFGDEEDIENAPGTYLKLFLSSTFKYNEPVPQLGIRTKGKAYIPGVSKRFRLVLGGSQYSEDRELEFSDDDEFSVDENDEVYIPDSSGTSGIEYTQVQDNRLNIAHLVGTYVDINGILWNAQSRLSYVIPLEEDDQLRWRSSIYWQETYGYQQGNSLHYDYLFAEHFLLEVVNAATWSEPTSAWHFDHNAFIYQYLASRHAFRYGYHTRYQAKPTLYADAYNVFFSYRRKFWRDWLFYEIKPEVNWAKEYRFQGRPQITFKIETHFGNQEFESYSKPKL